MLCRSLATTSNYLTASVSTGHIRPCPMRIFRWPPSLPAAPPGRCVLRHLCFLVSDVASWVLHMSPSSFVLLKVVSSYYRCMFSQSCNAPPARLVRIMSRLSLPNEPVGFCTCTVPSQITITLPSQHVCFHLVLRQLTSLKSARHLASISLSLLERSRVHGTEGG